MNQALTSITSTFITKVFHKRLYALVVVFAAGSFAALSMAPLNLWPALFVSLPLLYVATLHAPSAKIAGLLGWVFGFGYFAFSLSWVGNALLVEGNPYKWVWPLAVSGLPALLAFFPAFAVGLSKRFMDLRSLWGWLGFISLYGGFEWLRGHVFTGFPWNLFAYTWADHLAVIQILWLSDAYMLTWLTILWACVPACLLLSSSRQKITAALIVGLSFTGCLSYGLWQLRIEPAFRDDVNIRLVQPNIEQSEKWRGDKMADHFRKHLALSANDGDVDKATIIVWPETALSYRVFNDPRAVPQIQEMLRSYKASSVLLTGMLRHDAAEGTYTNSLVMIDKDGELNNVYNKHHLVPFGEYIPYQKWIPLTPIVQFKGFEAGDGLRTMSTPTGINYSPLICYEIIFPGRSVADNEAASPDFIVNVTNDAWYGQSAGPYQHFVQTVFRAIETGVPVVRSANTGFSAIISPQGRIYGQTELFKDSASNFPLPEKKPILKSWFKFKG